MALIRKNIVNPFEGHPTNTLRQVYGKSNPNFIGAATLAFGVLSKGVDMIMQHKANKEAAKVAEQNRIAAGRATTNARLATQVSADGMITSGGGIVNPYSNQAAEGGLVLSNTLQEFNGGGTHEQHPLGGIQIGMGSNGKPNTVET